LFLLHPGSLYPRFFFTEHLLPLLLPLTCETRKSYFFFFLVFCLYLFMFIPWPVWCSIFVSSVFSVIIFMLLTSLSCSSIVCPRIKFPHNWTLSSRFVFFFWKVIVRPVLCPGFLPCFHTQPAKWFLWTLFPVLLVNLYLFSTPNTLNNPTRLSVCDIHAPTPSLRRLSSPFPCRWNLSHTFPSPPYTHALNDQTDPLPPSGYCSHVSVAAYFIFNVFFVCRFLLLVSVCTIVFVHLLSPFFAGHCRFPIWSRYHCDLSYFCSQYHTTLIFLGLGFQHFIPCPFHCLYVFRPLLCVLLVLMRGDLSHSQRVAGGTTVHLDLSVTYHNGYRARLMIYDYAGAFSVVSFFRTAQVLLCFANRKFPSRPPFLVIFKLSDKLIISRRSWPHPPHCRVSSMYTLRPPFFRTHLPCFTLVVYDNSKSPLQLFLSFFSVSFFLFPFLFRSFPLSFWLQAVPCSSSYVDHPLRAFGNPGILFFFLFLPAYYHIDIPFFFFPLSFQFISCVWFISFFAVYT